MADLKKLGAKRAPMRVYGVRPASAHTMHEPSAEAETHCESSFETAIEKTGPLCSCMEASITCCPLDTAHTRTLPSAPPEMSLRQSFDERTAVTPLIWTVPPDALPMPVSLCASLMTYCKLPDCGPKTRILPSAQPERIEVPLGGKAIQFTITLGTCMRSSSDSVAACQMRISEPPHVAKSSAYPLGNSTPVMGAECEVPLSSATRPSYCTR
mmetsp:Transcript_7955/g.24802  ORF Transcript_7955/g.24802 Transcript_7955/m.24802 type:complete len:212 (-) Transcript_7955:230-865(-)|eukprot:scaffold251168_cov30-Tisochrysis_lutea.AAC.2